MKSTKLSTEKVTKRAKAAIAGKKKELQESKLSEAAALREREQRARKKADRAKKKRSRYKPDDLLALLPLVELNAQLSALKVDVQVKHLYAPILVRLFILAILTDKDHSLQALTDVYNSRAFERFSGKGKHQTAKNSLSDRFSTINALYFDHLYDLLLQSIEAKYGKKLDKGIGKLSRFDSTMIPICAALTKIGMRVGTKPKKGEGKVQIKVTVGLKGLLPNVILISHEQKMLAEETALKDAIEMEPVDEDGIITFDMGLKKRESLKKFDTDGRCFVTRLKNPRHHVLRTHTQIKGRKHGELKFLSDDIVYLYKTGATEPFEHEFRLITAQVEFGEHAGSMIYFLTNITDDMTAFEVADTYRRRWDIEVFFKFLKQHVGIKSLLSTNANGIKAVLYLRMIVGVLIWVYGHLNGRTDYAAVKREFSRIIEDQIFDLNQRIVDDVGLVQSKLYLLDYHKVRPKKQI